MTLLAFAADLRAAGRRRLLQQSDRFDIACPRGPQQQTAAAIIDGTDRQTDIVSLHRPRRMRAVSIMHAFEHMLKKPGCSADLLWS